ncbi:MAG: aminopeptidase, partial [Candidatus Omnitrophica bacterium]|nr:aminopeptidase [Candidatus Omnitrophota bacterium]
GYRKKERILIVTDDVLCDIGEIFYSSIKRLGLEPILIRIIPRKMHGEDPPPEVAHALKASNITLLITQKSLSHTRARQIASSKYGVRIASMPSITIQSLKRCVDIDYLDLKKRANALAQKISRAGKIKIKTDKGTELIMSVKGRRTFCDHGIYAENGAFGNLPAGEVSIAPIEGTTNGRLIVDASFACLGKLKKPIEINIRNGYATKISSRKLTNILSPFGKSAFNIAELGIGLNPRACVTGNILEDEKAINTAHIALGDNLSFGGRTRAKCHLDGVFFNPKIELI